MSWALINSVLRNCSVLEYLNMIFKNDTALFVEKINVKIYLCSTHFLKNMIKKAKFELIRNQAFNPNFCF